VTALEGQTIPHEAGATKQRITIPHEAGVTKQKNYKPQTKKTPNKE
jgi:hypothetical protein